MTAHALLSASASSRWLACPPSARLESRFPDGQSPYAAEGTQAHALAEGMLQPYTEDGRVPFTLSGPEWPKDMLDYVDVYVSIVLEKLNEARKKTPDAVLLVEQRLDFSPWVPEGFGTGDAVVISDNTLEIIDLKYGKGVPVSAEDNSQMRLYALGAFHNYGILYDFDRITMTIVQPRLDSVSSQTVDLKDLLDWGDKVKLVAAKAWRGEGEYCAGPHCRFCRAAVRCKKLAEYNLDCLRYEFMAADLMDPEDIVEVLKVEADVTSWLKTVKEYALDQAVNHGEKFPGMKLVEGRSVRTITDEKGLAQKLTEEGYTNIYKPVTLKGITDLERVCGKKNFVKLAGEFVTKPPGRPVLVPENDKRPVWAPDKEIIDELTKEEDENE